MDSGVDRRKPRAYQVSSSVTAKQTASESKLQPQLNGAAASGTNHRIGGGHVGSGAGTAERTARGIVVRPPVLPAKRIGKVGMIEEVEEFHAELSGITLTQFPVLGHG